MSNLRFNGFDWDKGNSTKNQTKHGIEKAVIEAFFGGDPFVTEDPKHSQDEQRYLAVGLTKEGRFMLVSFTKRTKEGLQFVRPISARYMHDKEVKDYEKAD
jgi:hypothetical protein